MMIDDLALAMRQCGFAVKVWNGQKIFVSGYGRELKISIAPAPAGSRPLDGAAILVTSTWRSTRNGQYCKGAKHALLRDLHACGFISDAPPDDWRKVVLDERPRPTTLRPFDSDALTVNHDA